MDRKKTPKYTRKEAEQRIPIALRHLALEAIAAMADLDKYPLSSRHIEQHIMSLKAYGGYLQELMGIIWRAAAQDMMKREKEAQRTDR